jgi:DNA-binding LacI/PurR family transcriptional regulator
MLKQSQIVRDLEQQIALGQFKPGQMLPTQKQLMGMYGVAMDTIQQAMGQLQSRGIVVSTRGRGTMVGNTEALLEAGLVRPRVDLLEFAPEDRSDPLLLSDLALVIQRQLDARGVDLIIRSDLSHMPAAMARWARSVRAVVVVGELPMRVHHALADAGRPIVVLGELYQQPCPQGVGQVTLALESMVDLAMTCLHMLGHRRILFVRGDWSYYFKMVSDVFLRSAKMLGCAQTCSELGVANKPQEEHGPKVVNHLQSLPRDQWPTALLIDGGQFACRTLFALQAAGIRVPDDISVFALNGTQSDHLPLPNLSRVEIPPERFGQRLADVLLESLRSDVVIRHHVPPSLHRGDTARALA